MTYPKIYGNWTVLSADDSNPKNFICQCACGKIKSVNKYSIISGDSKSCRCISNRKYEEKAHNMSEYNIWISMRARCTPDSHASMKRIAYVKKGISVCAEWLNSFETFYKDMGPRPSPNHSIDRIDNNGNYEPSNCRWATSLEQNRNKDSNHILSFMGHDFPVSVWSEITKIHEGCLAQRIWRKWPTEKALTTPMRGIKDVNPMENIKNFFEKNSS